jgi:hypothetical protein
MNRRVLSFALFFSLVGAWAWASTSALVTIESSPHKVPKARNQLKIEFTATKNFEAPLDPLTFNISGIDIAVIEDGQPGAVDLSAGPYSGYFIVELLREKPFKITVAVEDTRGLVPFEGNPILARLHQGNALPLSQDQFDRFTAEYRDARINEHASARAREVLAELKAQGLKIAVENWPHEDAFPPLENNQGLNVQLDQAEMTMDMALMREALSNPIYKDTVDLQLRPPGDIIPCYSASYATSFPAPGDPVKFNVNVMAQIHLQTFSDTNIDNFAANMAFEISTQTWVYDQCTDSMKLKTVAHPFVTDANGDAYVMVGYNASEPFPVIKVRAFAKDDNIEVGVCETYDPTGPDEWPCYAPHPRLISKTSTSILSDAGLFGSGSHQVENLQRPPNTVGPYYEKWDIYALFSLNDSAPYVRPLGPAFYPTLKNVKQDWALTGTESYMDFKACSYGPEPTAHFRDPICGSMIITVNPTNPSDYRSEFVPAHEAGHWFHAHLHGEHLPDVMSAHAMCAVTNYQTAWVEGFADFFALRSGYTGNSGYLVNGGEIRADCPDVPIASAYQTEGFVASFMLDAFDS